MDYRDLNYSEGKFKNMSLFITKDFNEISFNK